eukprot:3144942-Amphidinium_carterae.1
MRALASIFVFATDLKIAAASCASQALRIRAPACKPGALHQPQPSYMFPSNWITQKDDFDDSLLAANMQSLNFATALVGFGNIVEKAFFSIACPKSQTEDSAPSAKSKGYRKTLEKCMAVTRFVVSPSCRANCRTQGQGAWLTVSALTHPAEGLCVLVMLSRFETSKHRLRCASGGQLNEQAKTFSIHVASTKQLTWMQ